MYEIKQDIDGSSRAQTFLIWTLQALGVMWQEGLKPFLVFCFFFFFILMWPFPNSLSQFTKSFNLCHDLNTDTGELFCEWLFWKVTQFTPALSQQ